MTESVLERLGTTESTTLVVKREDDGKIRITSLLWPEPKVILRGEVLKVRNVDHRVRPPECPPRCDPQRFHVDSNNSPSSATHGLSPQITISLLRRSTPVAVIGGGAAA